MKSRRYTCVLLAILCTATLCAQKRVEFVGYDWGTHFEDQRLFESPFFHQLKEILAHKGLETRHMDLTKYRKWLKPRERKHWLKSPLKLFRPGFTVDRDVAYVLFWNLDQRLDGYDLSRLPKERLVLFMWEPPVVQPRLYDPKEQEAFSKIYTWDDSLVDNVKFFKFFYPVLQPMIPKDERLDFDEKKLCVLVATNLHSTHPKEIYSERERVIQFFETLGTDAFAFYGRGWEPLGYKNYKGVAANKTDVLRRFRFNICYENTKDIKGYVTEKIFDAFAAGCVPVYWGASNIADYVPPECFIDRRNFSSNEELYAFLKSVTKEEYEEIIAHIERFLHSDKAHLFSEEHFMRTFAAAFE